MTRPWLMASLLLALSAAEPPPSDSYLPPRSATPAQYAAPPAGGAGLRQTDAVFRSRPSSKYGAPGGRPTPSRQQARLPTEYGPPQAGSRARQQNSPSTEYGPPAQRTPSVEYGPPEQQYGVPRSDSAPQRQYLPPGGGADGVGGYADARGGRDEEAAEASYSFEYSVQDAASGSDFGHRETRAGALVQGRYYVLLPDGRRQTVEYMADQDGYRPMISYVQETDGRGLGEGEGGYDENSQRRAGGGAPY